MNFFSDLQHDYEEKASKWSVNFQGPDFEIPEKLKEDVALIGPMCEVSKLLTFDILIRSFQARYIVILVF